MNENNFLKLYNLIRERDNEIIELKRNLLQTQIELAQLKKSIEGDGKNIQ